MSKTDMCIVRLGYYEIAMPKKAALLLFDAMGSADSYQLDSKWDNNTKTTYETLTPLEVTLKAFSEEALALRKLQTHAWEEKERESKKAKEQA